MTTATKSRHFDFEKTIELVERHADALESAAQAVRATDAEDVDIVRLLGKRAREAGAYLWHLESYTDVPRDWTKGEEGELLYRAFWTLPLIALAAEVVAEDPEEAVGELGRRGDWIDHHSLVVAGDLERWAESRRRMLEERED